MKNKTLCCGQPTANVTINKSRVKIYKDNTIYLKDKQEFEVELFNPTKEDILAKISLNGEYISNSGVVIRPGERIFLDRFIDEPSKFVFDTYEVENSEIVKKAIENNGKVMIEFFKLEPYSYISIGNTNNTGLWSSTSGTAKIYTSPTWEFNPNEVYCGNFSTTSVCCDSFSVDSNDTLETGKVEKGTKSEQEFVYVDKTFMSYPNTIVEYSILPKSRKPFKSNEIKTYCTECGKKLKNTFKFCPKCGAKV